MTADYMKNGRTKTNNVLDQLVLTCIENDYSNESVFSKLLGWLMNKGNLLVAISSSGESKNIDQAIKTAREKEAVVIILTGFEKE